MTTNTVQEIEISIKEKRSIVELGNVLERLYTNKDFQRVIQEGYFRDEAVRLVHLRGDPSMQTPERQASIIAQIDAISALSQYFRTVEFLANNARKAIAADEEMVEELLAEELTNG